MSRIIAILVAWAIGWLVYMVAMVVTVYDGILSLIFQPFIGAIATTLAVGVGLLVGQVFRIPMVGRLWHSNWLWAAVLATGSILLMCFGTHWGITETFTDPETDQQFVGLKASVAITCYFVLVFAVANWPTKKLHAEHLNSR